VCIVSPVICYFLSKYIPEWFDGFQIGIELLLINALITCMGLYIISFKEKLVPQEKYGID